ncbi:MAG: thioredoxin-disulfide reductase [Puniceicoccales bacterium]|jgi:thioredoxin reductase (NADPH)|nr:thioredoxin-disulfide reductase [Puniceicoccales bacterium]
METLVILGSGCAGLTAAIYAARAGLRPLVFEGAQPGGQLTTTTDVENFPGFPDGVDGYTLTENMRRQAIRFGARFESEHIERLAVQGEKKCLHMEGGAEVEARAVIIATGAAPRLLGISGERDFFGGNGVTTCATCDGAFYRGMEVVVVGGGDSACEEALFLTRFATRVWLVHRRDTLRASSVLSDRVLAHEKITPLWNRVPVEILGGEDGTVCAIVCRDTQTGVVVKTPCKGIFIAIGHTPNTAPFAGILPLDAAGYIETLDNGVRTVVEGVFVAGDCADPVYRQAISAAGMGCRAAMEAERWLGKIAVTQ